VIEVTDLTKKYGRCTAIDGLSFTVQPGRVTGFLGPNGAGKSTTMRLMLQLAEPTRGEALINGQRYRQLSSPLRRVGAMLEAGSAHPGRTAREHLRAMAASNRIPDRRVDEVISLSGLESVAGKRVRGFSLGMKQRLGVAAAMVGDPEILLLDEPVNGLDPQGIRWIRNLLSGLAAEGRTVLVSSHLMGETALIAEHLIVIAKGQLLADQSLASFTAGHATLEDAFLELTDPHLEYEGKPVETRRAVR
jgi:ABC-2 type transport system ATP-binding protein